MNTGARPTGPAPVVFAHEVLFYTVWERLVAPPVGTSMTIALDHTLLPVSSVEKSVRFYYKILGLKYEPEALLRISPTLVLQLIERPSETRQHLAFSMSASEFEETLARLKQAEIPYGDNFDTVGTMTGPGTSHGSRKGAHCIYFRDPDGHMIEIMHYDTM